MPIYEYACPHCRVVFSFLSRRLQSDRQPVCPRCGAKNLIKEVSTFAPLSARPAGQAEDDAPPGGPPMPDLDDPRVQRAMNRLERDMDQLDENNPRHMAHLMRRMQEMLPSGSAPKDLETAIRRLEAGEDPDKIEEDMGDILGDLGGSDTAAGTGPYSRDPGLYDY